MRKKIKTAFIAIPAAMTVAGILLLAICNLIVGQHAARVYQSAEAVPVCRVGLLLGTSPETNTLPNLYFRARIKAAADLYKRGIIRKIIASGDNGRKEYDEVTAMCRALMEQGVRETDIQPDYAGFRTLDSVVRAKRIFLTDKLLIISQGFHCTRALFLASAHGIQANGFAAEDPGDRHAFYRMKMMLRECFARTAAVLDIYLLHRGPRILGDAIPIPD